MASDKEQAAEALTRAIELQPHVAGLRNQLGGVLIELRRWDEAIAQFRRAVEIDPDFAPAHSNLASALASIHKLPEAEYYCRRAVELDPGYLKAHNNLGNILSNLCRWDEALACYVRAIEINPDYADAHANRALAWLTTGNFAEGWPEYEWRWRNKPSRSPAFDIPRWNGEPLLGKSILLHSEQGLGDTIQFVRFAPLIKKLGARVIVECQSRLRELLASARGIDQLVSRGESLPEVDWQCPLMSLPAVLGTALESIPSAVPYLFPRTSLLNTWQRELAENRAFKIGIAWQGSIYGPSDPIRSLPLAEFAPLSKLPGVRLFSLQKGAGREQLEAWRERLGVIDLGPRLDESTGPFLDTAAVMSAVDLVVTSDTATAHLAGALGVPVWLALSVPADWRWLAERTDSPWYPSMRLFRQASSGDWGSVFQRMAEQLRPLVQQCAAAPSNVVKPIQPIRRSQRFGASTESGNLPLAEPIGIAWGLSPLTGWGVFGTNLAMQLAQQSDTYPVLLMESTTFGYSHPLVRQVLKPWLPPPVRADDDAESEGEDPARLCSFPVLEAMDDKFRSASKWQGSPRIALVFQSSTHFDEAMLARAKTYDLLVAGSSWNERLLKSRGLANVQAIPQGIDPTLFHPAPQVRRFGQRFVIFSGGKLEFRKGHDLVVAAFKRFRQRHPDALLVTNWQNHWPKFMLGLESTGYVDGLPEFDPRRGLQLDAWMQRNGIPAASYLDIGQVANHLMPPILREADVALFPNRGEGGTNLVAMECLACGVPTILSNNTGHLDLVDESHCFPLWQQTPVTTKSPCFAGVEDWGESSVDEIVEQFERVYADRQDARARGLRAAQFMQDWTWDKQVGRLVEAIREL